MLYNRNVPLRPLPSYKAKAAPSPKSRVREGQVQSRMEPDWDTQAIAFESDAANFALGPEAIAEVTRRVGDVERNAAKQSEIEANRVGDEFERVEKEKIEKELKAATAAKLKHHRRPQQRECLE